MAAVSAARQLTGASGHGSIPVSVQPPSPAPYAQDVQNEVVWVAQNSSSVSPDQLDTAAAYAEDLANQISQGRLLWLGAFRPGRMHDVTALRTEGIEDLLRRYPDVEAEVDAGYQGLARDFPGQVSAPPKKPGKNAAPEQIARWEQQRHQQLSQRICIEHAIAEPKQWRTMQRWTGRREYFQQTALAIAGLVSDRAAER